jgi:bifunctional non-homologous end joining protein LigD
MHVPLAKAKSQTRPDFAVFDLDPGPRMNLLDCARLSLRLRDLLQTMDLQCFAKTSGSKGVHVLVPVNSRGTFEQSREFARRVAKQLEQDDPEHVTATMAKHERTGKIFVDWNQNEQHKTTVCAYSLRATVAPGVSTPLAWEEIEQAVKRKKPERLVFDPETVLKRVERDGDLLAPALTMKQTLPKQLPGAETNSKPPARLKAYQAKRNFSSSPEPSGKTAPRAHNGKKREHAPIFCVQKHDASHLHYDFRLEHRGVLLSWAVPKGPSLRPTEKRLAMRVEDHPLDYANFEGIIPEGYGAGTVMVWDRGTWQFQAQPHIPDVDAALEKGELKFSLEGVKLKGSWVLVRTRGPGREDGRSWLLIKHRDEWAGDVDIATVAPLSVKTFRSLEEIETARS